MQIISVQPEAFLVRPLNSKRILIFIPGMVISIPEQLAGRVWSKPDVLDLDRSIDGQSVPIPEVIRSGVPTELEAIAILNQDTRPQAVLWSCLNEQPVLGFLGIPFACPDEFISGAHRQVVFVFFIRIDSGLHNSVHAVTNDNTERRLLIRRVLTIMFFKTCLEAGAFSEFEFHI